MAVEKIVIRDEDNDELYLKPIPGQPMKHTRIRGVAVLPMKSNEVASTIQMVLGSKVSVIQTVKEGDSSRRERWEECSLDKIIFYDNEIASVHMKFKKYSEEWTG